MQLLCHLSNQRLWTDFGQILRHQHGISVAESQTFLRAKRPPAAMSEEKRLFPQAIVWPPNIACVVWRFWRAHYGAAKPRVPSCSFFLFPRPPWLVCAPDQNRRASHAFHFAIPRNVQINLHWISKIHKLISHFKLTNFNLQMNCSAVAFAVLFLSLRCYCEKLDLNSDLTVPFHVIENREDKTMNDGNQLRSLHGGVKAMSKRNVNCGDGEMYCMDGQTCCLSDSGGFGCCPVPNVICCSNGVHCCPQGYICDYGSGGCRKSWSFV